AELLGDRQHGQLGFTRSRECSLGLASCPGAKLGLKVGNGPPQHGAQVVVVRHPTLRRPHGPTVIDRDGHHAPGGTSPPFPDHAHSPSSPAIASTARSASRARARDISASHAASSSRNPRNALVYL